MRPLDGLFHKFNTTYGEACYTWPAVETDPNTLLPLPSPLAAVELVRSDGKVLVRVRGVNVARYDEGDTGAMHCAAVAVAESGEVRAVEVAEAFGIGANYLSRLRAKYRQKGARGIVSRRGPKGPSKLDGSRRRRIRRLAERGYTQQQIAEEEGVSIGSVNRVLNECQAEPQPELPFPACVNEEGNAEGSGEESPAREGGEEGTPEPAAAEETKEAVLGTGSQEAASPTCPSEVEEAGEAVGFEASPPVVPCGEPVLTSLAGAMLLHEPLRQLELLGSFEAAGARLLNFRRFDLPGTLSVLALGLGVGLECVEQFKFPLRQDLGAPACLPLAPELRTLRRKLVELSECTDSVVLMRKLAQAVLRMEPVWEGLYYTDSRFTTYHGKLDVPKSRDPRTGRKVSGRTDTYVHDVLARPLFYLSSPVNQQLVTIIPRVLQEILAVAGENEDVILMFDRGGWSAQLFAYLDDENVGFAAYMKGTPSGYEAPPDSAFKSSWFEFEGKRHTYLTAELELTLGDRSYRVVVFKDKEAKIAIVTNLRDMPAAKVVHLLKLRWRQENNFKDLSENCWIDGMVEYGGDAEPDPTRIRHPERVKLQEKLAGVRQERLELEARLGRAAQQNPERARPSMRGFKIAHSDLRKRIEKLRTREEQLEAEIARLPARIRRCDLDGSAQRVVLRTERRNMVNALKLAVHNAERWLARKFQAHFDDLDEYRAVLRNLLRQPGELRYDERTRTVEVRLRPPDSPKVCHALERLLSDLNELSPRTLDGRWAIHYALGS